MATDTPLAQEVQFQIGVQIKTTSRNISGAQIQSINYGSVAAQSGLRQGDVILFIREKRVETASVAVNEISRLCGDSFELTVFRTEESLVQQLSIKVKTRPAVPCLGMALADATVAYPFVEIVDVLAHSPAARAGLRSTDLIIRVNSTLVFGNMETVTQALQRHGQNSGIQQPVNFTIDRSGKFLDFMVPVERVTNMKVQGSGPRE